MSENEELFTTRMRKATRKIHSVSDALVNAKFAISLRDEKVWGGGLFVFYHIFAYLEDAKDRLNMPDFNKLFVHNILHSTNVLEVLRDRGPAGVTDTRKKAFEEDLNHYLGENWQSTPKSAALENYLLHLQGLEKENPDMLMAYVYHLYLGLLSGGQILAKKRKMMGQTPNKEIYIDKLTDFSQVEIPQLKVDFRKAMNEIADKMSEEWKEAFIEESNQVFLMNNLIVDSVGGQNQVLRNMMYKVSAFALIIATVVMAYKMR